MKPLNHFILGAIVMLCCFWLAMCEAEKEQPCEPVTIHHFANLDSALQHYAPYSNLISDTSIYRTQIAELQAELLAVTEINGKLRTRLVKAAQDIAFQHEQLRHCIYVKDTTKTK